MAAEVSVTKARLYPRGFSLGVKWKWPLVPARDLVTLNYGRSLKANTRRTGKVPVYGTNGQCGWHDEPLTKGPGIVLGRKGQGPLGVEWCQSDFWVIDTAYFASTLRPDLDLKYLYHLIKYIGLNHLKDGTSNPTLSRDSFGSQLLPVPPLSEQKVIAQILGTLDDMVELNRRTNATLEAMARALFQTWFVDFDPVRAKLEGRKPGGLDTATAGLFPAHFQDSPLGPIPQGLRVMKFGDFIKRLSVGQKYDQKSALRFGTVPVLDQGKTGVIGFHNNAPSVEATFDDPVAVFANHTCYMRLITYSFSAIQNVLPFIGADVDTIWAYYATEGRLKFSEYKGHWPDFVIQEAVVPSRELADAFGRLAKPLVARIRSNEEESRTLVTLRDTLLPKLLSGELRVSDSERIVEAHT